MEKQNVTRAYPSITWNFDNCSKVKHLFSNNNFILNDVNTNEFRLNLVLQNTRMIASRKIICFECFNCFHLF